LEEDEKLAGMVNITEKPPVFRKATATGSIRLQEVSVEAIKNGRVKKGDVLTKYQSPDWR
jgi:cyclic pyranopterin phosphate synthase